MAKGLFIKPGEMSDEELMAALAELEPSDPPEYGIGSVGAASLKVTELKKLARNEAKLSDYLSEEDVENHGDPWFQFTIEMCSGPNGEDDCEISSEDALAAIENIKKWDMSFDEKIEYLTFNHLPTDIEHEHLLYVRKQEDKTVMPNGLHNGVDEMWDVIGCCEDCASMEELEERLKLVISQFNTPYQDREWGNYTLWDFIEANEGDKLYELDETALKFYHDVVERLAAQGDNAALHAKAYSCFGGSPAFECDWAACRDCILKYDPEVSGPHNANMLGIIAYNGYCSNGVPDYKQAYEYFSYAAICGVDEAKYLLADMYYHGLGVTENKRLARQIVSKLYDELREDMISENFDTRFADVAYRMSQMIRNDSYDYEFDRDKAYVYMLEAEYAVKMREQYHYNDDDKLRADIGQALQEMREEGHPFPEDREGYFVELEIAPELSLYCSRGYSIMLQYEKEDDGSFKYLFDVLPRFDDDYVPSIWINSYMQSMSGHYRGLMLEFDHPPIKKSESGIIVFNYIDSYGYLYHDGVEVGQIKEDNR